MDGWMEIWMDGEAGAKVKRWMNGWKEGWMDGELGSQTVTHDSSVR